MPSSQQIVMPKLGLTMTEGVLAEWKVAPGDAVRAGDVIFVVETDKISNEIEAVADAVVDTLHVEAGAIVPVGEAVATFQVEGEPVVTPDAPAVADAASTDQRVIATPLARRLANDAGIEIEKVAGSGPRGRIMADDVNAIIVVPMPTQPVHSAPSPAPQADDRAVRPLSPHQQVTARRLTEAKRDIPHFYVMAEADVTDLTSLRRQLNDQIGYGKLTVTHFIIDAVSRALAAMPEANLVWSDGNLLDLPTIDVGIAIEGPKGLVAPVLRDLGNLSLDEIAAVANTMIDCARKGSLTAGDFRGGAISVSNVGMFGATGLVPIINPGQSMILGVGRSIGRFLPDADGHPVLRQILNLTLSCDHRVIDGALAARFLTRIQNGLEAPLSLLRRAAQGTFP